MEFSNFQNWLEREKRFQKKSARDVISRLKRSFSYVNFSQDLEEEDFLFQLQKKEEFKRFSSSVKSQLKRAVSLYWDFLKSS